MIFQVEDKNISYHMTDFTTSEFAKLIALAKKNYRFITYEEAFTAENFILWRHDCDYSLNRALRLARIEAENKICATYFLNPHCEYYNLLEKGQTNIIKEIVRLGHRIGLHFDAQYYDITEENQLAELIIKEAKLLEDWFGIPIKVFSFHNPNQTTLSCDKETYGGLINCYSKFFKEQVSYCSDSNGYWRFRRLHDVLEQAKDSSLHILTHPEWWQETPISPRSRILRCVEGRASYSMTTYDALLLESGRTNVI